MIGTHLEVKCFNSDQLIPSSLGLISLPID